jgi:hypothetical protein
MAAAFARFVKKRIAERERGPRDPLRRRSQQNLTAVCAKVYYQTADGSMSFARQRYPVQEALFRNKRAGNRDASFAASLDFRPAWLARPRQLGAKSISIGGE